MRYKNRTFRKYIQEGNLKVSSYSKKKYFISYTDCVIYTKHIIIKTLGLTGFCVYNGDNNLQCV